MEHFFLSYELMTIDTMLRFPTATSNARKTTFEASGVKTEKKKRASHLMHPTNFSPLECVNHSPSCLFSISNSQPSFT